MRSSPITALTLALLLTGNGGALARQLVSHVEKVDKISAMRREYPVPDDSDMLFYVQRSVNDNTVVYAAHRDSSGHIDAKDPVEAYWRWFHVDGHKKPLNFVERAMAYGVGSVTHAAPGKPVTFQIVALPERVFSLQQDGQGHPMAVIKMGDATARLVYLYLQVDDRGLIPKVLTVDVFGIDTHGGGALHEHVIVG